MTRHVPRRRPAQVEDVAKFAGAFTTEATHRRDIEVVELSFCEGNTATGASKSIMGMNRAQKNSRVADVEVPQVREKAAIGPGHDLHMPANQRDGE
jgi:hypothetical protein